MADAEFNLPSGKTLVVKTEVPMNVEVAVAAMFKGNPGPPGTSAAVRTATAATAAALSAQYPTDLIVVPQ